MSKKPEYVPQPPKSRAISARLSPYTYYCLLLLARAQRRTLSDVVEWCIHSNVQGHEIPGSSDDSEYDLARVARETFSTNKVERIVKLGVICPQLFDYEDANVWRVLEGTPELWSDESVRGSRKLDDFLFEKAEGRLADLELFANERADKYPVSGLSESEIKELGWELSPKRHRRKED